MVDDEKHDSGVVKDYANLEQEIRGLRKRIDSLAARKGTVSREEFLDVYKAVEKLQKAYAENLKIRYTLNDVRSAKKELDSAKKLKGDMLHRVSKAESRMDSLLDAERKARDRLFKDIRKEKDKALDEISKDVLSRASRNESDIRALKDGLSGLRKDIESRISTVPGKKEFDKAVTSVQQSVDKLQGELESSLASLDGEVRGLKSLTEMHDKDLKSSKASSDDLQKRLDSSLKSMSSDVKSLQSFAEEVEKDIKSSKEKVDGLESSLGSVNGAIDGLKSVAEEHASTISGVNQSIGDIEKSQKDISASIKAQLKSLEDESRRVASEAAELSENLDEIDKSHKNILTVQDEFAKQLKGVRKGQEELEHSKISRPEMQKEIDISLRELQTLKIRMKEYQQASKEASQEIAKARREHASDREELKSFGKRVSSVEDAHDALRTEVMNRLKDDSEKSRESVRNEVSRQAASISAGVGKETQKLRNQMDSLKQEVLTQRKLLVDSKKLEKRVKHYRDDRISRIRLYAASIFLGMLAFYIMLYYYNQQNPALFPGLQGRLLFFLIITGVFLALSILPYSVILPRLEQWMFAGQDKRVSKKKARKEGPSGEKGLMDRIVDFFDEDK